jgi:hypothetical protein
MFLRVVLLGLLNILLLSGCALAKVLTVTDTDLKPRILYHGSNSKNLTELEPRAQGVRDESEGNVIFAALDPALASIFITRTYQDGHSGKFCSACPYYFVYSDEEKFKKLDVGGAIYFLPIDSFYTMPNKGLGTNEWVSKSKVKPLFKIEFASSLQAMMHFGVQVFFVSSETFAQIKNSSDHGKSILLKLRSENEKLEKNYFPVE